MSVKKPENKKCPNCGACQECGHGGTKPVPYPGYPYPPNWYRPYATPRPWHGTTSPNWQVAPNTAPGISGGFTNINATNYQ